MKKLMIFIFCCAAITGKAQRTSYDVKKIMSTKGLPATNDFDQYEKWQKDAAVRNAVFMMDNKVKDIFTRGTKDTIIRIDDGEGDYLLNIFTISKPTIYESFFIDSTGTFVTKNTMQFDSLTSEWAVTGIRYQVTNKAPFISEDGKKEWILPTSEKAMNLQHRVDEYLKRF